MLLMTHLWRHPRSNAYWYRRAVPKARRAAVGLSEFKKSLRTTDLAEAKRKCSAVDAEFERLVFGEPNVAPADPVSVDLELTLREAEDIALRWREGLLEIEYEAVVMGPLSDEHRIDEIFRKERRADDLRVLIKKNEVDDVAVPGIVNMLIEREKLQNRASPYSRRLLAAAVTRAYADVLTAIGQFRRGNMDYRPQERLFFPRANGATVPLERQIALAPPETPNPLPEGPTIAESFESFIQEWRKPEKTTHEMKATVRLFIEFMGLNVRTATIEKPHIEKFKLALFARPRSMTAQQRALPLPELLKQLKPDAKYQRVTPTTVGKTISFLNTFLDWCQRHGHIKGENPAAGMKPPGWKKTHSRLPFSSAELQKIFSAPIYTGFHSPAKWWEPGPNIIKDERYWIPILGLYLGARPIELGQLLVDDIKIRGSVVYFEITTINPHSDNPKEARRVKTRSSERTIVVHPDLLRFGFLEFVERARENSQSHLFPGLVNGSGKVDTDAFSKWFARFLDRLGITDKRKVFYSFRHGFEDALRDAVDDAELRDLIMGHADKATRNRYGLGHRIAKVSEAMRQIKFEGVDLTHLVWRGD